jgi:predicted metalloprotease
MRKLLFVYMGIVVVVFCITASNALHVQAFGFAPPQGAQAISHDSNTTLQLSVLDTFQAKIASLIPKSVNTTLSSWDAKRASQAQNYARLEKALYSKQQQSTKGTAAASTQGNLPVGYYWYQVLAFFFGHAYVFYGVVLILILLLIRFILLRFNYVA